MSEAVDDLLVIALQASVPLYISEIRDWSTTKRMQEATAAADIVASQGDNILFKSKEAGGTAQAFNGLARALAILAFQPGGVSFAGCHWIAGGPEDLSPEVRRKVRGKTLENVPTGELL